DLVVDHAAGIGYTGGNAAAGAARGGQSLDLGRTCAVDTHVVGANQCNAVDLRVVSCTEVVIGKGHAEAGITAGGHCASERPDTGLVGLAAVVDEHLHAVGIDTVGIEQSLRLGRQHVDTGGATGSNTATDIDAAGHGHRVNILVLIGLNVDRTLAILGTAAEHAVGGNRGRAADLRGDFAANVVEGRSSTEGGGAGGGSTDTTGNRIDDTVGLRIDINLVGADVAVAQHLGFDDSAAERNR